MQYITLLASGVVLGVANIIPGVSGGTMAVVFNVFDRLIDSISNFTKDVKGSLKFLIPLLLGMAIGILAFAKLITFLLENYPVPTNFFFIGLILGSIPMVYGRASASKVGWGSIAAFAAGLLAMVAMVVISPQDSGQMMRSLTVVNFIILFIASAFAAIAMIIPGISGSFLMLVMGTYSTVTGAVASVVDAARALISGNSFALSAHLDAVLLLIPVALGVVAGLLGGAKLIERLLKSRPSQTYACILGLVIGSLFVIFPGLPSGAQIAASVAALACGGALAFFSSPRAKA